MDRRIYLAAALTVSLLGGPALAEPHRGGHGDVRQPPERHWQGDIRHFHDRDIRVWRGGEWRHGQHGGHFGWWWVVGGIWYLYANPIHPYPDPYVPPAAVTPAPAAAYWYYCDDPPGYYPYVPECRRPWQPVPANPPGAPLR